jgi:hypothetical protein
VAINRRNTELRTIESREDLVFGRGYTLRTRRPDLTYNPARVYYYFGVEFHKCKCEKCAAAKRREVAVCMFTDICGQLLFVGSWYELCDVREVTLYGRRSAWNGAGIDRPAGPN